MAEKDKEKDQAPPEFGGGVPGDDFGEAGATPMPPARGPGRPRKADAVPPENPAGDRAANGVERDAQVMALAFRKAGIGAQLQVGAGEVDPNVRLPHDQAEPGGRYVVDGREVNAWGEDAGEPLPGAHDPRRF